MKALFIGGTGTISAAISRRVLELGWELWHINRGNRSGESWNVPNRKNFHQITCDISNEKDAAEKLAGLEFDVTADFIAFTPDQVERDFRLFKRKTQQYIFISSASAYQKPLSSYRITESTPLSNPLWDYSRQKIACEEFLIKAYREEGFPITIVRPSHTYDKTSIPMALHGDKGGWPVIKRMISGKKVIIHGDGTTLWTLTHSRDFAVGFAGLMGNVHAVGEAVQITSDESLTWNAIHEIWADVLGVPLNAVHVPSDALARMGEPFGYDFSGALLGDKAHSVVFDNAKIKRLVPEYNATTRFDQGAREIAGWFLSHPELQAGDEKFDEFTERVITKYDV